MEEQAGVAKPTNPLLAHLNDTDESHASTRVDFMHPGTTVQPMVASSNEISTPVPTSPPPPPPPPIAEAAPPTPPVAPPAPKSPHNRKPLIFVIIIVLVLAALGGGAYWWFKVRKTTSATPSAPSTAQTTTPTAIAPTSLTQLGSTGQSVSSGGTLKNPLELDFTMTTNANSGSVEPQVEVQPLATAFTGQPNYKGAAITPNGSDVKAKVSVTDLKDGTYHWQARFAVGGTNSSWTPFAATGTTTADFAIDSTAPSAATVTSVGSQNVKSGATSITTTANPTTISGTAEAGDAISVAIAPDNQTATATADASGVWSVTLQQALANGDHTVTITATDKAGNTSTASFTISSNTATAAPATQKVAATGDNTNALTLLGVTLMAISAAGLILVTRLGHRQT